MSKTHLAIISLFALTLVFSCKEQQMPGFRRMDNGIYYKLISIGESNRRPKSGDYLEMSIYNTFADSVIYDSHLESSTGTMIAPFNEKEGFARLHEGDSALFLIPAYDLMERGNDTMMHMQVKLIRILNEQEYTAETTRRSQTDEFAEQKILTYFLKRHPNVFKPLSHGLFMQEEHPGTGKSVERGDRVLVNYRGLFLNGKKFDSTSEPVEFTLGDEGQLLEGMTIGLEHMKEGGKAKFIIPSQLAYGASGSTTGIIKPFSTLVYEVELLKVN
jgi:FKBP-type peptidyl-prolyl cis-trans isomerase